MQKNDIRNRTTDTEVKNKAELSLYWSKYQVWNNSASHTHNSRGTNILQSEYTKESVIYDALVSALEFNSHDYVLHIFLHCTCTKLLID